jgi:hypothetical protein
LDLGLMRHNAAALFLAHESHRFGKTLRGESKSA